MNLFEKALQLDRISTEIKETLRFAQEKLEKDEFVPMPAEKARIESMVKWMR